MRVDEFSLPLSSPLSTAAGDVGVRDGYLVRVDYGPETGVGEATPLPGWTESGAECRAALSTATDLARAEDWGVVLAETDVPAARHGLSLALADAKARIDGTPLYRTLGPTDDRVESVPVNATVGDADRETTVERAEAAVEAGFDAVKVKVGARDVPADVGRLRAVREAVGPGVELRADANGAWTVEQARAALEALSDLDLAYVEQPLPAPDLEGHADLRGAGVPVALDESLTERSVDAVLAAGAADVVVLKPMALGGLDLARVSAARARDGGVEPVVSTTVDGVVARTAAAHLAASIPAVRPCGLATADRLAEDLAADPAPVSDGRMAVPQSPGHGVDVEEA